MSATKSVSNFNHALFASLMDERGYTLEKMAVEVGIDKESVRMYKLGNRAPSVPVFKMICHILGVSEEELKAKPSPKSAVSQVLENKDTLEAIAALDKKIDQLNEDLGKLAKLILDATKVANEAKAQAELNRDELTAIFNKGSEINAALTKVNAKLFKKY